MPRTLQFRRYNTTQLANTTGANGEIIINTTTRGITVHDGVTPGGYTPTADAVDSFARTTANSATTLAQSAYNYANTIVSDTQIDPYARATANTASNNITIIQGVDTTQNTRLNSIETINANQNTSISIIQGVDTTQNTNITTATNLAQAAFNTANNANTRTVINGLGVSKLDLNSYGSNTAYLTTTSDDSTALFMGTATTELYAYTSIQIRANTGGTSKAWTFGDDGGLTFPDNTIQTTAWTGSAIDQTARNTANTATNNITIIQGVDTTQNTRLNSIETINNSQNTSINAAAQTVPQNAQSTNYVLQLTDAGKHIYYTQASNTILYIPTTSNVAFSNGSTIMIVSRTSSSANVTVSPNTGVTMYLAGNTTSASRNVTTYGMATLIQVAANTWFINGTGVS